LEYSGVLKTRNLLILRPAKNAVYDKIAPNWNVSGTRKKSDFKKESSTSTSRSIRRAVGSSSSCGRRFIYSTPKFLIFDRDATYGRELPAAVRSMEISPVLPSRVSAYRKSHSAVFTNVTHCYIALKTCHNINSPGTGLS